MELIEYWRLANCVLATTAFVWLMLDLRVNWPTLTPRRVYLTFSLAGLLCAVVVGSIENIVQHNPIGIRTALTTASCAWCVIGLWISHKEDRKESR